MAVFLFLGGEKSIMARDVIGVFDIEATTVSKMTRNFLSEAQKKNTVESVGGDIPKTFVITADNDKNTKVYLSPSPTATLARRIERKDR